MRLSKSWIIATKDLKSFIRKRTVLYTAVLLPLLLSVLFPAILEISTRKSGGVQAAVAPGW
jgi:ABC-type Na+ efflux pump permease subunit